MNSPKVAGVLLHPLHPPPHTAPHPIYWADMSRALASGVINNNTVRYSTTENIARRHHHSAMVYITCDLFTLHVHLKHVVS